jgi:hypothetical protein
MERTLALQTGELPYYDYELKKYKIVIAAIQEIRWSKSTSQACSSNGYNMYISSLSNRFFNYSFINIHAPKNDSDVRPRTYSVKNLSLLCLLG